MNTTRICCITIFIVFISDFSQVFGQQSEIDSMRSLLSKPEDDIHEAKILQTLTLLYDRVNQDSVDYFSNELLKHSREIEYGKGIFQAYNGLGMSFFRRRALDSSAYYFKLAYQQALQVGDTVEASRLMGNVGAINVNLGNYETALTSFFDRLEVLKDNPSTSGSLGKILNNIAACYHYMGNESMAIDYYHKSLMAKRDEQDRRELLPSYEGLAAAFSLLEEIDSALYYGRKTITLARELNDNNIEAGALLNIGVLYRKLLQYDSAEVYLNQSLKMALEFGNSRVEAKAYTNLGTMHYDKHNYSQALEYHKSALPIYTSLGFKDQMQIASYAIAENLKALGRFKEAYDHLHEHVTLKDSIYTEQSARAITEMQTKYETEQKEQQIELQKAQIEVQTAELSRQQIIRNVAIVGFIVLAVIVGLVYRNNRIKVKAAKEIASKNEQLSKSLNEREALLKEIHHRVKNNLQVIASLLYLQSDESDNLNVKRLLEEGQGRVRSMALIHQKLYENDDLKHIPFDEYLKELIREIQHSFGQSAEEIELEIDAQDVYFDVDTAVPLGLIINELSTNAFKYAYANRIGGEVLKVEIYKQGETYHLIVADNGKGIPDQVLNSTQSSSLGLKLTKMLSEQLEGEYNFKNNNGTTFELKFAV